MNAYFFGTYLLAELDDKPDRDQIVTVASLNLHHIDCEFVGSMAHVPTESK